MEEDYALVSQVCRGGKSPAGASTSIEEAGRIEQETTQSTALCLGQVSPLGHSHTGRDLTVQGTVPACGEGCNELKTR